MLKSVSCALMAMVVSGCSTTPIDAVKARAVPAERMYNTQLLVPDADRTAQIVVSRDQGLRGSACSYIISVDNVKVMALRSSESATLHVAPGSHFLRLETTGGLCGSTVMSQNAFLEAGDRQVYRAIQPSAGEAHLSRVE